MRNLVIVLLLGSLGAPAWAGLTQYGLPALSRSDFNRLAMRSDRPLFWARDDNRNGLIDPAELAVTGTRNPRSVFVARGRFTAHFEREYRALVELRRRESVRRELESGRPALVRSDLSGLPRHEKVMLRQLLDAGAIIDQLYLRQTGARRFTGKLSRLDPMSRALFRRNHGPWCVAPGAKGDPFCNALPVFPRQKSEAYPADFSHDEAMCKLLQKQPNASQLLSPFTVVRRHKGGFKALPLNQAFGREMRAVAAKLRAAAAAIDKDPKEAALRRYLLEAARGFETNQWTAADEAWAAMSSGNSRWYLRIGPDETYFDPCQQKAGFHVSLARIDQTSLVWQQRLTPLRSHMERAFATLIGRPYRARQVQFSMPDFIAIVLNSGDSRHPLGAIVGQSLPNWGKVAEEGRGRTVVMSNIYDDPDSRADFRKQASRLVSDQTMAYYTDDTEPYLLDVILHEATHNLGPTSSFLIKGKPPKEVFGGALASTLEELKAQAGGIMLLDLLRRRKLLSEKQWRQAHVRSLTWAFGHISRGMYTPSGNVQPYSQLAAVIVGTFMKDGALTYHRGKFTLHFAKIQPSLERLVQAVGRAKARGDVAGGRRLIDYYVKGKGRALVHADHIAAELRRFPKASFRYSVTY